MQQFRYFPPNSEEQRAFAIQFAGTIGGLVLLALGFWHTDEIGLRGVLIGCAGALIYLLVRAAWDLELKARRSQTQTIGVDNKALHLLDDQSEEMVLWDDLKCEVRNGILHLSWQHNGQARSKQINAREMEDGMKLIGLIARRGQSESAPFVPPSNFIPLSPK